MYADEFAEALTELHNKGAELAKAAHDESESVIEAQTNGPKKFVLEFHEESFTGAGFPDNFFSAELIFIEANDLIMGGWHKTTTYCLRSVHEIENITNLDIEPIHDPVLPGE